MGQSCASTSKENRNYGDEEFEKRIEEMHWYKPCYSFRKGYKGRSCQDNNDNNKFIDKPYPLWLVSITYRQLNIFIK